MNETRSTASATAMIIPALNEEASLRELLPRLRRPEIDRLLEPVIVVDNGSTDQTAQVASQLGAAVVSEPRRGYGAACLAGLAALARRAEGPPNVVAFLDADLADDPMKLPELIDPILRGEAELTIGTRARLADRGSLTPVQRFGNALACSLIRAMTGVRYRDCGPMRAIEWGSLQRLNMRDRTWGWTVEMQFKAARAGLRVRQIDVPYRARRTGKSKISGTVIGSARAGAKILYTLAALALWRPRT